MTLPSQSREYNRFLFAICSELMHQIPEHTGKPMRKNGVQPSWMLNLSGINRIVGSRQIGTGKERLIHNTLLRPTGIKIELAIAEPAWPRTDIPHRCIPVLERCSRRPPRASVLMIEWPASKISVSWSS